MFGRVPNTSLHIVAFRLKYFLVGGTFNDCHTAELTNKRTNNRLQMYYKCQMLTYGISFLHKQGPLFCGAFIFLN